MVDELNQVRQSIVDTLIRHTTVNGVNSTKIHPLHLFKATELTRCDANVYKPSLILTVQGAKSLFLYCENQSFNQGECLISSIDIPITSNITSASEHTPYFSLVFELDLATISSLMVEMGFKVNVSMSIFLR
ncbi:AraC family transcriptional regulator [Shewanella sp. Isolate11]|uniref:AraC family transcriptional regulator n=1 Tax=Shewanella sp. Isolate11 TaxID=2908530 RepID=UPI0023D8A85C|nr:AraC family transcriptional regulator [Shewanella sp. Isolate11]